MPKPPPARTRKSRRSQTGATRPQGKRLRAFIGASVDIEKLVAAEQRLAEVSHGLCADFNRRLVGVARLSSLALRFYKLDRDRSFAPSRRARESQLEGATGQAGFVASFAYESAGHLQGSSADKSVVQKRQRLRGDGRLVAAAASLLGVGPVERLQQWIRHDPLVKHI